MKQKQILNELLEVASEHGIIVRKEKGNFKTGFCILNDKKMILINKSTPIETTIAVIALCLNEQCKNVYIKPKLREYIEKFL